MNVYWMWRQDVKGKSEGSFFLVKLVSLTLQVSTIAFLYISDVSLTFEKWRQLRNFRSELHCDVTDVTGMWLVLLFSAPSYVKKKKVFHYHRWRLQTFLEGAKEVGDGSQMESAEWRKIQGSLSSAAVRHQLITISQDHWRNHLVLGRLTNVADPGSSAVLTPGSGIGKN